MNSLKEKCTLCSSEVVKNSPAHFKFDCNHSFCQTCVWEMAQAIKGEDARSMVLLECRKCHRKTPFNRAVLPTEPSVNALSADFGEISLTDSDDFDWGNENESPHLAPSDNSCPTTNSQIAKIRELIEQAEKRFSERMVKRDSDKIASACQALEKKSTKSFTEIVDLMRRAANDCFDEAQLLVDKKINYLRRSSTDLNRRIAAKAEAVATVRKAIDETSFFNASNSDAACLYLKVAKLKEEISNLSDVSVPFGGFKETPLAESFFANYCHLNLGTFDARLATTPLPVLKDVPPAPQQLPKPTPSPVEWTATPASGTVVKTKQEPPPPKTEPQIAAKVTSPYKSSIVATTTTVSYDAALYSQMTAFAIISTLSDEKRSLCRPVGVCALAPSSKRQAAVVHTGHKVTIFSAAANVVGTYVLADPDNRGRVQLVGDIASDSEGWIYVLDRDNLPSRIFAFQPDRVPVQDRQRTMPDVFARVSGRIRIYGLAVSSAKQTLYTSTRDTILGFSLNNGQNTFECPLKNPPSAYVHSLFEDIVTTESRVSKIPFVVFTANEGRSIYKKAIVGKGGLEATNIPIASHQQGKEPISLVRRTGCDPVGNILGADSGKKEIRVFSSNGEALAKFAPPPSYGSAFSASGVAVIAAAQPPNQLKNGAAEKCAGGMTHLGPVVVVTDFERHRILFFDVPASN